MKIQNNSNRYKSSSRFGNRQKVNRGIMYYNQVKVIDEDDQMIGIMESDEAIKLAKERGLDLVEVSSNVTPPICKILDYGKYKYNNQKQANQNKKNQKVSLLKEIKLRVNIGGGDYNTKLKKITELIEEGHKVKISLRLRGREMMHKGVAVDLLKKISKDLLEVAKLEKDMMQNNNQFSIILISNAKK